MIPNGPDAHAPRGSGGGLAGGHRIRRARHRHGSFRSHRPGGCQVLRPGPGDHPAIGHADDRALPQADTDFHAVFSSLAVFQPGHACSCPQHSHAGPGHADRFFARSRHDGSASPAHSRSHLPSGCPARSFQGSHPCR